MHSSTLPAMLNATSQQLYTVRYFILSELLTTIYARRSQNDLLTAVLRICSALKQPLSNQLRVRVVGEPHGTAGVNKQTYHTNCSHLHNNFSALPHCDRWLEVFQEEQTNNSVLRGVTKMADCSSLICRCMCPMEGNWRSHACRSA